MAYGVWNLYCPDCKWNTLSGTKKVPERLTHCEVCRKEIEPTWDEQVAAAVMTLSERRSEHVRRWAQANSFMIWRKSARTYVVFREKNPASFGVKDPDNKDEWAFLELEAVETGNYQKCMKYVREHSTPLPAYLRNT